MNNKDFFIVKGLSGQKVLNGTVEINGAKNAALKAMAAAVLFNGPVVLQHIPDSEDIHTMTEILTKLGVSVKKTDHNELSIDASDIKNVDIDPVLAKKMRASIVLTGPMLGRFGKVKFPLPGGCVIGERPIDLFIKGYEKMGAVTTEGGLDYRITGQLNGTKITFEKISVGATETLMMAAVLAKGKTILENCAKEPEIGNVAEWLNACGAKIKGIGTPVLEIEGTDGKLLEPHAVYEAIPDRIEAGSFLILGALCAKDLLIKDCEPKHLELVTKSLQDAGLSIDIEHTSIHIKNNTKANEAFRSFDIKTREYPGFPTDLQAPATVFMTQATGISKVEENIFEGRFKYVDDLNKMGARITVKDAHEITVHGPTPLNQLPNDEELNAHDIRAGFAIVLAALLGKGCFKINNVHLIDRGYEKLEDKLSKLGADITRTVL